MEAVTATVVTISDDYYGDMQLTVWISAAQGDVYLLEQKYFDSFAASGAFMDLGPLVASGQLNAEGFDLAGGYAQDMETEVTNLYGIPAANLPGFTDYMINPDDMVLCILYNNGNDENSIKFLNYMLENLR